MAHVGLFETRSCTCEKVSFIATKRWVTLRYEFCQKTSSNKQQKERETLTQKIAHFRRPRACRILWTSPTPPDTHQKHVDSGGGVPRRFRSFSSTQFHSKMDPIFGPIFGLHLEQILDQKNCPKWPPKLLKQ